jgi:hypothetical protein
VGRRWTPGEDRQLGRLYAEQLAVGQIALRLGRSADAVVARRRALGIAPRRQSRPWSVREEALVRAGAAAGVPASLLASRLHRSVHQIRGRRRVVAGARPAARPYLPPEDALIRLWPLERGELVSLADRLGRSPDALRLHAQQLGVHRPRPRRRWTAWEDALIRDGYTSALPCNEIAAQLPHRSVASVAARARKLGLSTYARRWSAQDECRLAHLTARGDTLEDVAQRLGRTQEAIRRRAVRLGARPPAAALAPRRARRWSTEEDELLRLHSALNPARLAQLLGRSDAAVCRRLCALGLRAGAQRSPHHPVSRPHGQSTPGERATIGRTRLRGGTSARRPIAGTSSVADVVVGRA